MLSLQVPSPDRGCWPLGLLAVPAGHRLLSPLAGDLELRLWVGARVQEGLCGSPSQSCVAQVSSQMAPAPSPWSETARARGTEATHCSVLRLWIPMSGARHGDCAGAGPQAGSPSLLLPGAASSALLQAVCGLHHSVAPLARGELPAEEGRGALRLHPLDPLACEGRRGGAERHHGAWVGTAPPGLSRLRDCLSLDLV